MMMDSKMTSLRVVAVATVMLSCVTWGHGFRNPPAGPSAISLDGGKAAFLNDPSAISHNPANLAERPEKKVMASLTLVYPKIEFESAQGPLSAETEKEWKTLPNLYATWPVQGNRYTAGLGITTPYGQSTEWDKNVPFAYYAELALVDVKPTIATKIRPDLSAGVGLDLYVSDLELKMFQPGTSIKLCGDATGVGGNAGLTWTVAPRHKLALVYHSQFDMEYEGDTEITGVPTTDFETEIKFPNLVLLGYGVQLTDKVQVGVDVEWVEFSRNDSMPMDYGNNPAAAALPPEFRNDWDDVWTAGMAISWKCAEDWTVRGSYKYLESPIPDETYSPLFPDSDKHVLSTGLGWAKDRHALDFAYMINLLEDRDIRNNIVPSVNGDYEYSSHVVAGSYTYAF